MHCLPFATALQAETFCDWQRPPEQSVTVSTPVLLPQAAQDAAS